MRQVVQVSEQFLEQKISGFWSSLGARNFRFGAAVHAFWSNFGIEKSTVWRRLGAENVRAAYQQWTSFEQGALPDGFAASYK